MPAEIDVAAYLASKGVDMRQASGSEVTVHCWACPDGDTKGRGKLYVNTDDGWFNCKRCGATGGTTLMLRAFGDEPDKRVVTMPGQDPAKRRQILEEATALGEVMLGNNDDVMLYLCNERGLWPETVVKHRFGVVCDGWSLTGGLNKHDVEDLKATGLVYRDGPRAGKDFFYDHLLIPYRSRGTTVQMRGRALDPHSKAKYMTGPGDEVRLFNADVLDGADDVLIIEGEFDTLVVEQALSLATEDRVRKIAVVGIAGAGALPPNFESYFKNAKRVYIGLDPDDTGKKGAIKIKELLGTKSRIIEWPVTVLEDGLNKHAIKKMDWSEYVNKMGAGWREIVAMMGTAQGKRLSRMREAGEKWRTAKATGVGIKTGYAQLDATILPGILPGQVMVILAKTGTGKTVLLCNLAVAMRTQRVLFISLEMTSEEVYDRLRRIYLFHNPLATDELLEQALDNILICDENRLSDKDLESLVEEYEVETGHRPDVVYVDYLGYYARGQKGASAYEKTTNAIMQLKAIAKQFRMAIITPHQVNRMAKEGKPIDMDDARDSGAVEETADFLLSIYRPDDALAADGQSQQSGRVKMSVLKSRHGGKDRTFTFVMDLLTLAIVDDTGPNATKAQEHNHMYWRGNTYEQLRKMETAPRQLTLVGTGAKP